MTQFTVIFVAMLRADTSQRKYAVVRTARDGLTPRTDDIAEILNAKYPEFKHENARWVTGYVPIERIDI